MKREKDQKLYIGLDLGSVSLNLVVMDEAGGILEDHYIRMHGQPVQTCEQALREILSRYENTRIGGAAVTGSAGKLISRILGIDFVNEIVAQSTSTARYYPQVRTIIEIGGEDSKLILLDREGDRVRVADFAMNTLCAAGTGAFLDQQASRLGMSIEEFGRHALKSKKPPRIAGRCSVFAKTDMIHLQQEGTPDYDIVAGLCYAMARNFRANIAKGKEFKKVISFQGGVAANAGIVKAFQDVLELEPGELLIPEHFASMGAAGAVLARLESEHISPLGPVEALREYTKKRSFVTKTHEKLETDDYRIDIETAGLPPQGKIEAYVGVDVGSISTNVVVIDSEGRVLSRRYLMTAGRPIEAVVKGLYECGREVGERVEVRGVATTGSGRYLTGDFIGADVVVNEITAHATGAALVDSRVDTIFEIGGQDSKFISLENGAIVDFTMNKVCAAGTGSFLEEQAERLGIKIEGEFAELALSAQAPAGLGERCTVFMETDLTHLQQQGVAKENLVAGLSYSIVLNYLNKVVEDRKIGDVIFFQGGTAYNRGVKAAFEKVLGKKVIVPPHHDVLGAIGAALIAKERSTGAPSSFKGFDLREKKYTFSSFECKDCPNHCEIREVLVEGETPLRYGSRCGKFDEEKRHRKGAHLPRLFSERKKFLYNAYPKKKPDAPTGKRVGIPQITTFFELLPLWKGFFTELGLEVVISDDTNREIINIGCDAVAAETCFPIKVAHGHVVNVLAKNVDYLFLPSVINMAKTKEELVHSYACPYVQSIPYLVRSGIKLEEEKVKVLQPTFHFERGEREVRRVLRRLGKELTSDNARIERAIEKGLEALENFYRLCTERGKEILNSIEPGQKALVIVSRPYNGCDTGLNLNLPGKLRDLGVLAIPMDFLPLEEIDITRDYPHMYWKYGQRILAAARIIAADDRLNAVYISNFGCGPDSFISKFFARELGGKPHLTIEVDEHSADVGAITRCEAFLDSLKNARRVPLKKPRARSEQFYLSRNGYRKVYVPYMDDHGFVFVAAMRACGRQAEPLPMSDEKTLELGRKFSSGKECYPCILTTGDIMKKALSEDFDKQRSAFFMPTAYGPCRFGQYNKFHRMVLDDHGFDDVPIVILDQTRGGFEKDLMNLGADFKILAWKGIVITDMMQKLARHIRPYEVEKGRTDDLYKRLLAELCERVERRQRLDSFAEYVRREFEKIPVDRSRPKPKIGIVGEIYVRCNSFANNFVGRRIEELGGEVSFPALEEWVNYISWVRIQDFIQDKDIKGLLKEYLSALVQRQQARGIQRRFRGMIDCFLHESPASKVLELGERYLPPAIRGEAVLSLGRAVEYAHHGFDGVVNLVPFQCMPGTVVNALLNLFQKDYPHIPILKLAFDGLSQGTEETRLEAFMYQARQHLQRRLETNAGKP